MKVEKIESNNVVLVMVIRSGDWEDGLNFVSKEEDFIQVGFWRYENQKELLPHIHQEVKREILKTQEVIFVKKGSLQADVFTPEGKLFSSVTLKAGDTAIFLNGGHGYKVLEEKTEVLEVKNGPYVGPELDRRRI